MTPTKRMGLTTTMMTGKFDLIPIGKVRELLAESRYGKSYKELDNSRQLIIEELIRK